MFLRTYAYFLYVPEGRMDLYSDLPSKKVSPLCKIQCCGQFQLSITSVLGTTFAFDMCIVFRLEIFWTSRHTTNFDSNQHGRSSVLVHLRFSADVFEAASKLLRVCIKNNPFASRSLGRQKTESVDWKEREAENKSPSPFESLFRDTWLVRCVN